MTQMKSSIFPWIESSISPGDKARLQYLIVCLLRAVPQADRIALLNTATQAWQSKPSIKIERPPLPGSACGGNAAFLCARNAGRRKSLRSAACLLITATCAANSSPNKGGDLFSRPSGRRRRSGGLKVRRDFYTRPALVLCDSNPAGPLISLMLCNEAMLRHKLCINQQTDDDLWFIHNLLCLYSHTAGPMPSNVHASASLRETLWGTYFPTVVQDSRNKSVLIYYCKCML